MVLDRAERTSEMAGWSLDPQGTQKSVRTCTADIDAWTHISEICQFHGVGAARLPHRVNLGLGCRPWPELREWTPNKVGVWRDVFDPPSVDTPTNTWKWAPMNRPFVKAGSHSKGP